MVEFPGRVDQEPAGHPLPVKTCRDCQETKPLSDFYRHPRMADGLLGSCKNCRKTYAKQHRRFSPKPRQGDKDRSKTPERKQQALDAQRKRREKNPEKTRARGRVNDAIRYGKLRRGCCEVCGIENAQAHHSDYSKPLDVRWFCVEHHFDEHYPERTLT